MKQIEPKTIWINGEEKNAVQINVVSLYDDLSTRAEFRYDLLTADQLELAKGTVDIAGEDYLLWNGDVDINMSAYQYVVSKLNLVLS
jgi:hypothetical protein